MRPSSSVVQYFDDLPAICRLLVDHYGRGHDLGPADVLSTIVLHFMERDEDLSPAHRAALDASQAPSLRRAAEVVHFYAETYETTPPTILTGIIRQFVLGDDDFDLDAFHRFVETRLGITIPGTPTLADLERHTRHHAPESRAPRCPVVGTIDVSVLREVGDSQRIGQWLESKVSQYRCPASLGSPDLALRGLHSRSLSVLRGTLSISPTASPPLPEGAGRHGLFTAVGQRFEVLLRYSTSGGSRFESIPDSNEKQAIGLGLKVLTPDGETHHDLLFINSAIFPTNDPLEVVSFEESESGVEQVVSNLGEAYAESRESAVRQVLDETQFSASAYSWGAGVAVKYALRPLQTARALLPIEIHDRYDALLDKRSETCLEDAIRLVMEHGTRPLSFSLSVQFADPRHEPSFGCPTDDERIEWKTPWVSVGEIEIDPQAPLDGEALSFSPFHVSHAALLPIGALNRSRLSAYGTSQRTRHHSNAVTASVHPHHVPVSQRVAVVGGGASGLASALALASFGYRVTVLERSESIGGHACVKDVEGGRHRREPAFGAFRAKQWPNLWALLEKLGVEPISHGQSLDWFDSPFAGWFARDGHPITRSQAMLDESQRIVLEFTRALRDPSADGRTAKAVFDALNVSPEYLMTGFVGGVIHYFAGHPIATYLDYPIRLLSWMWLNNAARTEDETIELFRVDNALYMERFAEALGRLGVEIRTGVQTTVVERGDDGVRLRIEGEHETEDVFSDLVLAIQPHHALTVLGTHASAEEKAVLGAFEHTEGTVIVHRDPQWMPREPSDWKLFNVLLPDAGAPPPAPSETLPITINKPCSRDGKTPIFATYDYAGADHWDGPADRFTFEHVTVNPDTQRLRQRLAEIQGRDRVQFCGSWSRGLTLHEDALVTGFEAANRVMGPHRAYRVLDPPVPMPAPFEEWVDTSESLLAGTRTQLLSQLESLIDELQPGRESVGLTEDTEFQSLVTSSLHLARLANALSARMPQDGSLDISVLLHMETVGELLDAISDGLETTGGPQSSLLEVPSTQAVLPPSEWTDTAHPVSFAQQSILVSHFLANQASSQWNIPLARWFVGPVPGRLLREALEAVAQRHTALRTLFVAETAETFSQHVQPTLPTDFFYELPASSDEEARLMALAQFDAPMDVTRGVLRVRVIRTTPSRSLMVMVLHHAVGDGWSIGLLLRELRGWLHPRLTGQPPPENRLHSLPPQQIDAAHWARADFEGGGYDEALTYWENHLSRPLPSWKAGKHHDRKPHVETMVFSAAHLLALKALSREWKTSLNVILITAYAQVIGRLDGRDEIVIRLPTAARTPETEGTIGCFADALVLRLPCAAEPFTEAVARVHTILYAALRHPLPFTVLWKELRLTRRELMDLNQVIINLEQGVNVVGMEGDFGGAVTTEPFEEELRARIETSMIRSVLSLNEQPDGTLQGEWFWSEDLASDQDGRIGLTEGLRQLLGQIVETGGAHPLPSLTSAAEGGPIGCPFLDRRNDLARDTRDLETLMGWYDEAQTRPTETDDDVHLGTLDGQFIPQAYPAPPSGVFSPGRGPLDVRIRLSVRFGAGGLALKVHDGDETLHDLLFLTTTTIPNNPVKLVRSAASNTQHGGPDALFQPYYSISPYSWGRRQAVKFRLQPRTGQDPASLLAPDVFARYAKLEGAASATHDAKAERLALLLANTKTPIVLALAIQRATNPELSPVDDTLVEWTSPFETVAEIRIEPQQVVTAHDGALRFNPFHVSHSAFLPLGRLNRIRREVYDYTASHRGPPGLPYGGPRALRVGVVGGGVSGLTTALALADFGYQVTVFERAAELGGHACSKPVLGGAHVREPAFGAFRRPQWPNFVALLDTLGIDPISHGQSAEWFDSPFVGWFRSGGGPVDRTPEVDEEARRFIVALTRCLDDPEADGITVGELITSLDLSQAFVCTWFLGGAIHYFAGHSLGYYLAYPARVLAWMWLNNATRGDGELVEILRVDNKAYMTAFESLLRRKGVTVHTEATVRVVQRDAEGVTLLHEADGAPSERLALGTLVLAIAPHHALEVLGDQAREEERAVLGGFEHTVDVVQVHREAPVLGPPEKHKLLNIVLPPSGAPYPGVEATVPIIIKKTCVRDGVTPLYATYDYARAAGDADPDAFPFEHVRVTPDTQRLRQRLTPLQGTEHVHFCGSWSRGLTLHEDGIVSALLTANRILGPGREVEILQGPVPQPEPFGLATQIEAVTRFGETRGAILSELTALLGTVLETDLPADIDEDTALEDIHLSSLHFARLANAITARLPPALRDEVDIVILLQMETVGELTDYLYDSLYPPEDAKGEFEDEDDGVEAPQPVPGRRDFVGTLPRAEESPLPLSLVGTVQALAILVMFTILVGSAHLAIWGLSLLEPWGLAAMAGALPVAFGGYLAAFSLVAIGVKWSVVGRLTPGRYPIYGPTHLRWWIANLFLRFGQQTFWAPLADSHLGGWLLRRLGASVHPTATATAAGMFSSLSLIDADLLTLEEGVYIRPQGRVRGHMFLDGDLVLAPTTLEAHSSVWKRALVEPGATLGRGATLEAHSVLSMGQELPAETPGIGIPAQVDDTRVSAGPVLVSRVEAWTYTLVGLVFTPWMVAGLLGAWGALLSVLVPGATATSFDPWILLLGYPVWVVVTAVACLLGAAVKWGVLGRLRPGMCEEDHPIALPLVRMIATGMTRLSLLWPRHVRWAVVRAMGARISAKSVTGEPFMDLAYADLFNREAGVFFSPAAFVDFVQPQGGKRVLHPVKLVQSSYIGAYCTLTAPVTTTPMTVLAGCSALEPGTELGHQEAWVGAPARRVPIRMGEVSQDAFDIGAGTLLRLRLFEDGQQFLLFTILMSVGWAGLLLFGKPMELTVDPQRLAISLGQLVFTLGLTWAIFIPLVRWEGRRLRRAVEADPVLARDGIERGTALFRLWVTTVFHVFPLALTTDVLAGTPFKNHLLRALGTRVGKRVYVDHEVGLSEFPFLHIDDGAVINEGAALIGHSELPNGRIAFKVSRLEEHSSILWSAYLVGGTRLPARAILGSLSRPFDGQELAPDAEYDNTPCRRRGPP